MGHDPRAAIAELNDGAKVLEGEESWDVDLHWHVRTERSKV